MNKAQTKQDFIHLYPVEVAGNDKPALAEAWNNYTDQLCKSGGISDHQYSTWTHPTFTKAEKHAAALRVAGGDS